MNAPAKHLSVRNVPPAVMKALDRLRQQGGTSLNQAAIDALTRGLGVTGAPVENGLRALSGDWSEADLRAFEAATTIFERIDEELWK